jgi:hypothetical protein
VFAYFLLGTYPIRTTLCLYPQGQIKTQPIATLLGCSPPGHETLTKPLSDVSNDLEKNKLDLFHLYLHISCLGHIQPAQHRPQDQIKTQPNLSLGCLSMTRDGNGYPRPDTRWIFTPLGYVCGLNILPVGLLLGKNLHPMGKRVLERSAFTHTR